MSGILTEFYPSSACKPPNILGQKGETGVIANTLHLQARVASLGANIRAVAPQAFVDVLARMTGVGKGGFCRAYLVPTLDPSYKHMELVWKDELGEVTDEKRPKYRVVSFEKALRTGKNIKRGHRSSFESMNLDEDEYQGAIAVEITLDRESKTTVYLILSFSGLPSSADEAAMLLIAKRLDPEWEVSRRDIFQVINQSKNQLAIDLGVLSALAA